MNKSSITNHSGKAGPRLPSAQKNNPTRHPTVPRNANSVAHLPARQNSTRRLSAPQPTSAKQLASRGPNLPAHQNAKTTPNRLSTKNHRLIITALAHQRSQRLICLHVREICRTTNLTPTTFYKHGRSANLLWLTYEQTLESNFTIKITSVTNKTTKLLLLLNYVRLHQYYFAEVLQGLDLYLLVHLIAQMRLIPERTSISPTAKFIYAGTIAVIVTAWGTFDQFSPNTMDKYLNSILNTRVMNI